MPSGTSVPGSTHVPRPVRQRGLLVSILTLAAGCTRPPPLETPITANDAEIARHSTLNTRHSTLWRSSASVDMVTRRVAIASLLFLIALVLSRVVWSRRWNAGMVSGDVRVRDTGFWTYPRYTIAFPTVETSQDVTKNFTVAGLPPCPMTFEWPASPETIPHVASPCASSIMTATSWTRPPVRLPSGAARLAPAQACGMNR